MLGRGREEPPQQRRRNLVLHRRRVAAGKGNCPSLVVELLEYSPSVPNLDTLFAKDLEANIGSRTVLGKNGFRLVSDNFGLY